MNTSHSSLIRGLNIAITALAALSLITCIVAMVTLGSTKDFFYDAIAESYYDGDLSYYDDSWYDYLDDDFWYDDHDAAHPHHTSLAAEHPAQTMPVYGYSTLSDSGIDDAYVAMDIMIAVVNGLLIWEIVVSIVALLFGILGLVNAGKQDKLKQVMVFGIVGAVVSFLGGHIILMALFIISAVMANKDKTALLNANLAAAPPVPPTPPTSPAPPVPPATPGSSS